jgi:hypothetical protein
VVKSALGLSLAAILLAIAALFYQGTIRIDGAVSGWISGVGSLASALVALGIALYTYCNDRRERREELKESRARALRRAKRVGMKPAIGQRLDKGVTYVTHSIDNGSGSPLYEVRWYPPVVVWPAQLGRRREVFCDTGAVTLGGGSTTSNVLAAPPRVVENGDQHGSSTRTELLTQPKGFGNNQKYHVYPVAAFEDDDGNRFGWTLHGTVGSEGRDDDLSGRWDFVDDEWPWKCGGPLRELFNEAKGWAPGAEEEKAAEEE